MMTELLILMHCFSLCGMHSLLADLEGEVLMRDLEQCTLSPSLSCTKGLQSSVKRNILLCFF